MVLFEKMNCSLTLEMAKPKLLHEKNYLDELCQIKKHPSTSFDTTVGDSAEVKLMTRWSLDIN